MSGFVPLAVLIVIAVVLCGLAVRAWKIRNVAVKVLVGLIVTALALVTLLMSGVGLMGLYRLAAPHGQPAPNLKATASSDELAIAARRVNGCTGCHSTTGAVPL